MKKYKVIFSDIDGTLLNSQHRISKRTLEALQKWTDKGNDLVLTSSRGVSGIMPIVNRYGLHCSIIALGGAVILNSDHEVLLEKGMSQEQAKRIAQYVETNNLPVSWCIYSTNKWIVKSMSDPKIRKEASIVEAEPTHQGYDVLKEDEVVGKVLLICDHETINEIQRDMKLAFPDFSITKSSDVLLELLPHGISKASAVQAFCEEKRISLEQTIAFGDNYNDLEMLSAVALPIVMGNAPQEIKEKYAAVTLDNNSDGIAYALEHYAAF